MTIATADDHYMVWLTALLVFFAGVQAAITWWGGVIQRRAADAEADRRLKERAATAVERTREFEAQQDVAFFQLWGEAHRISDLALRWENLDLVELSLLGLLDPYAPLNTDPGAVVRNAAALGRGAVFLGTSANSLASRLSLDIELFNRAVDEARRRATWRYAPNGLGEAQVLEMVRGQSGEPLGVQVEDIRRRTREIAALLQEAANRSPRAELNQRPEQLADLSARASSYAASARSV